MAAHIRVVDERAMGPVERLAMNGIDPAAAHIPPPAPSAALSEPHPEVVKAIHALAGRLQAVETATQGVPKTVGLIRVLLAALGARALVCLALLGCLGLAAADAVHPTWEGTATFGAFAVLVYLPIAALAYFRGN